MNDSELVVERDMFSLICTYQWFALGWGGGGGGGGQSPGN